MIAMRWLPDLIFPCHSHPAFRFTFFLHPPTTLYLPTCPPILPTHLFPTLPTIPLDSHPPYPQRPPLPRSLGPHSHPPGLTAWQDELRRIADERRAQPSEAALAAAAAADRRHDAIARAKQTSYAEKMYRISLAKPELWRKMKERELELRQYVDEKREKMVPSVCDESCRVHGILVRV
jgi:hypothetical protein